MGAIVGLGALTLYLAITAITHAGWNALTAISVGLVFFWNWRGESLIEWALTTTLCVVAVAAAWRLGQSTHVRVAMLVATLVFSGTLAVWLVSQEISAPDPVIGARSVVTAPELRETPDVYLIVLDGYARADVLEELYSFDNTPFLAGSRTVDSAWLERQQRTTRLLMSPCRPSWRCR